MRDARSRVVIEHVEPEIDAGRFPVKRTPGERVVVEADIFAEGHDLLAAELLWRAADEKDWQRAPMVLLGNDRWRGTMTPKRIGRHLFTIEAWRDDYGSLCHALEVKHRAGVDVQVEIADAKLYLGRLELKEIVGRLPALNIDQTVALLASSETRRLVAGTE